MLGDIWKVGNKTWYSEKFINKIIDLCKKSKNNILADKVLKILDYKDDKGEK